ncbi:1-phosphofructokinase family hexose kinase [Flindersiella endophytica]
MIVTVTPNPAIDRTLEFVRLRTGEVNRAVAVHVEPSGKGINVSRALTVNGIDTVAVLPVGGAEGAQLAGLLDAEGVAHVAVPIEQPIRVNISLLDLGRAGASATVTKANEPGPKLSEREATALVEAVEQQLTAGQWVVGSGALPRGVGADFYARLGERVVAAGGRFALDSSGSALAEGLAARPALVKPNIAELAELAGRPLPTLRAVVKAAEAVHSRTGGAVLVTLGPEGAVLVDGEPPLHAEVRSDTRLAVSSAVGAGDNLLAGFLAGDADRADALTRAVAWASVAVETWGSRARAIRPEDLERVAVHDRVDGARIVRA